MLVVSSNVCITTVVCYSEKPILSHVLIGVTMLVVSSNVCITTVVCYSENPI